MDKLTNPTDTQQLEAEREWLHKRVIQIERQATLGRLTASLIHELNNPMQVIQGMLKLASEDSDNSAQVKTYLEMSLQETKRVVELLNRFRHAYNLDDQTIAKVDLNQLLPQIILIARREFKPHKVILQTDLAADLPLVTAAADQFYLALLSLLLNLSEAMGEAGGGELCLRTFSRQQRVGVELSTDVSFANTLHSKELEKDLGLLFSQKIIIDQGGTLVFSHQDGRFFCQIELTV